MSSCGKTVLSDFGISSYFEPDSQLETPYLDNQVKLPLDSKVEEDIVGSAYWIAPEIVRMKGASFLSDIW